MKAKQFTAYPTDWCYLGIDLLLYQLAFGFTLRWYDRGPHFRLYVGPVKLYGGMAF